MTTTLYFTRTLVSVVLTALILIPIFAFAQLQVEVGANATGTAVDSATDVGATLSDSVIETEVDVDLQAKATHDEMTTELGVTPTLTAQDVALMLNDAGVAIISSSEVESNEDLHVFAANTVALREGVDRVTISDDEDEAEITVVYRHNGRLFGLMPVTIKSYTEVTIDQDGGLEVDSDIPWWGILVTQIDHAEAEIESRIKDNPTVMMNAEARLSARAKAEIAEAVVTELEAHGQIQAAMNR